MSILSTYQFTTWQPKLTKVQQEKMTHELEAGQVIYMPKLKFKVAQTELIDPKLLQPGSKNISYDTNKKILKNAQGSEVDLNHIEAMMAEFSKQTQELVASLFPHYQSALRAGRTSFRPAQIIGRQTSYRKNDKLLHVDAFPSTPMRGERIIRVFSNINPTEPREWHLGESFDEVMHEFVPKIKPPIWGKHAIMNMLGITKQKRSLYDHYMLNIHDKMKADQQYQDRAIQEKFAFPAGTTWLVFSDLVSHAALAGQHLLEQTFYLPADKQLQPELSPLVKLEQHLHRSLNC